MGIFDAINNFSAQQSQYKPQAWTGQAAPTVQNLGNTSTVVPNTIYGSPASGGNLVRTINGNLWLPFNATAAAGPQPNFDYGVYKGAYYDTGQSATKTQTQSNIYGPTAAGYNNAAAVQMNQLTGYKAAVDKYANPAEYYNAPTYNSMEGKINESYGQASQSYASLAPSIQSLVDKYSTNTNLFPDQVAQNKSLADSFTRAKGQYNQVDLPQNALTAQAGEGISNLNQIYGAARGQFDKYTNAGNDAVQRLQAIQSGDPNSINNVINNPLIQMQLQQGLNAVNQSASAQGMLRSGQTLKQLQQLGIANAGNAVQQYQQNLLNTANLGNAASGSVAGLYAQQQSAEMARAKAMGDIDTTGATTIASNRLSQVQAQQAADQATAQSRFQALGLSQTNAAALAKLKTEQSAAATAEAQTAYSNNAAASQATYTSKQAANQAYLNQLLNIANATSNVQAQQQYGLAATTQYKTL